MEPPADPDNPRDKYQCVTVKEAREIAWFLTRNVRRARRTKFYGNIHRCRIGKPTPRRVNEFRRRRRKATPTGNRPTKGTLEKIPRPEASAAHATKLHRRFRYRPVPRSLEALILLITFKSSSSAPPFLRNPYSHGNPSRPVATRLARPDNFRRAPAPPRRCGRACSPAPPLRPCPLARSQLDEPFAPRRLFRSARR